MQEHTSLVTFKGNPMTLLGNRLEAGMPAPDFTALANDLSPRSLESYSGKTLLISAVPSLDTGICDIQTRRFNAEAAALDPSVRILTISCDLPFAQARWCGAAGANSLETLSDHKDLSFGMAYGLVIKELRLLARAVLVINKQRKLTYFQLVPEIATEPNYNAALEAVKASL